MRRLEVAVLAAAAGPDDVVLLARGADGGIYKCELGDGKWSGLAEGPARR